MLLRPPTTRNGRPGKIGGRFGGIPDCRCARLGAKVAVQPDRKALTMTALALSYDGAPAPAGPAVVSAEGLVRRYGEGAMAVEALAGVSLDIEAGRMTAIMGPSGSGKSTLMHLMAGLDMPTEGRVILDGVDITRLPEAKLTRVRRETIGFVFQFFNLLPMLTAEENVTLPLAIAGRKPDA